MSMVISLDIGTSKICVLSYDTQSKEVIDVRSYANDCGIRNEMPGFKEQSAVKIRDICLRLIRDVVKDKCSSHNLVERICVTGQMHGIVLVNDKCKPVSNLITWEDTRVLNSARGNISELYDKIDMTRLSKYGYRIQPGHGLTTLYWLKENGLLPNVCKSLSVTDFVTAYLCGRIATDPTQAASWDLYDIENEGWNYNIAEQAGIVPEILPEIIPTGTEQGLLRTDIAEQLGIKGNVIVNSGIGDNQASVIGASSFTNSAVLNLGTGGQLSIPINEISEIKGLEIRPMPYGRYIAVATTSTGGSGYANLKTFVKDVIEKICGVTLGDDAIYQKLNEAVRTADKESCLRVKMCCDGINNEQSFTGITRDSFVIGNLAYGVGRAIVESLFDKLNPQVCIKIKSLILAGNFPRRNPFVLNIVQNLFGVTCKMSDNKEEAAYGAAIIAARSVEPMVPLYLEKKELLKES